MGYLAYMIDTLVEELVSTSDVQVVKEFANVFPEELPGVPPERQVQFRIHLGLGVDPIANAPYRVVPTEMQELSFQLQEFLGK